MKVSATLKGTPDSLGRRTVYIRKADGSKRSFFVTNIKLEPKYWNKKVVNHPNAKALNEKIKELITGLEAKEDTNPSVRFHQFAMSCISKWESSKKESTLLYLKNKVDKFKKVFDGDIRKVTPSTLEKFADYCYSTGNTVNTAWSCLKAIRTIMYEAKRQRVISENPFEVFAMPKYRDPEKVYLTKEQVEKIEDFLKTCHPDFKIATAWFLISCYTGLRYGDQAGFNKKQIKDGRLIVYTAKTGKVVSVKINPKLKELFLIVDFKPLPYTNQHYNRLVKAICAACEIEEKVSVHTGRHTFGTLCASAGISQEVAAALMGHNSIRTTAIYYQITGTRIDGEFDKLFLAE